MHVSHDFSLFFQFCLLFCFSRFCLFVFKEKEKEDKGWSYTGGKVGRIWEEINEVKLIKICNMKKILAIKNQIYLLMSHSFNMMLKILSIIKISQKKTHN